MEQFNFILASNNLPYPQPKKYKCLTKANYTSQATKKEIRWICHLNSLVTIYIILKISCWLLGRSHFLFSLCLQILVVFSLKAWCIIISCCSSRTSSIKLQLKHTLYIKLVNRNTDKHFAMFSSTAKSHSLWKRKKEPSIGTW